MKFTFYGQSCFQLELGGKKFLFDPFIAGNELAKDVDINRIEADYILVSHGHGDHTADLIPIAKRTGALVISNFEIITWLGQQGITNSHPMNFGSYDFEFGTLTYMQAQHSSSLSDGTYAGAAGGFILASDQGNFYYSGDTSLMLDMQLVPYYARVDVAILPIGGNFTMNAKDALKASDFIQCNNIVGVHFDTFGYIKIDHEKAKKLFNDAGKKLLIPEIGATYDV
ncbi:hydrolase [Niabella ginsenosidivorans]|uniref:Hydrolase n=1 Tax=Niabella ginsenosidivorans TaxID=1176587 RepID=A0A1A9I3G3_9BACT|nr:metal-dependent hydrolase [Niabella ginsenosidivorans]ANH82208.1 hydrolase [Niabella ginsenosidivorans]